MFSDVSSSVNPNSKSGLATDEDAIKQSIDNFFNTSTSMSRFFRPDIFSGLEDHVFDLINEETAFSILSVFDRLELFDPRINVNFGKSDVIADPDNNRYDVIISYSIAGDSNSLFSYKRELSRE